MIWSVMNDKSPLFTEGFCTETGRLIEHIYDFLMFVKRILAKYVEKSLDAKVE